MIPFLLLEREDGREAAVRADEIGVVLSDHYRPKGAALTAEPIPALTILLRNNTAVKVVGVTRRDLFLRMSSALARPVGLYRADGTTGDAP